MLQYGGDLGGVLASAYPPNDAPLNSVFVYQRAFQPDYKGVMKNVFLHELGHVLGLRHEFALEKETQLPAAQWGTKNPLVSHGIQPRPNHPAVRCHRRKGVL